MRKGEAEVLLGGVVLVLLARLLPKAANREMQLRHEGIIKMFARVCCCTTRYVAPVQQTPQQHGSANTHALPAGSCSAYKLLNSPNLPLPVPSLDSEVAPTITLASCAAAANSNCVSCSPGWIRPVPCRDDSNAKQHPHMHRSVLAAL